MQALQQRDSNGGCSCQLWLSRPTTGLQPRVVAGERFGIYYLQLAKHNLQFVIIRPACYQEVARNRGPVDDIPGRRRLKKGSLEAWKTPESEVESEREGKDAAPCLHFDSLPPATAGPLWGVQLCGGYAGGSWSWSKHQIFFRPIPWQFYTCSGHFNMRKNVSRQCSSWRRVWSTFSLTTLPSCRASWLGSRSKISYITLPITQVRQRKLKRYF